MSYARASMSEEWKENPSRVPFIRDPNRQGLKEEVERLNFAIAKRLELPPGIKELLLKVYLPSHRYHRTTYMSQKTMAEKIGVTRRTISRYIRELTKEGYLLKSICSSHLRTKLYALNVIKILNDANMGVKSQNVSSPVSLDKDVIDISIPSKSPLKNDSTESHGKDLDFKSKNERNERKVVSMFQLTEEDSQKAQEMIRTMESATSGIVKVNPDFAASTPAKLVNFLKNKFDGDMGRWEAFCKHVGSSSLMQCKNGFVPALLWLIHDKQVNDLRRGIYHKSSGFIGRGGWANARNAENFCTQKRDNRYSGNKTINDNANSSYKTQINKYDFLEKLKCDFEEKNLSTLEQQITRVKIHILNSKRFLEGEYISWFQHMKAVSCSGDTVTVQLPNPFFVDYFKSHFKERLEEIWIKENPESSVKFIEFVADQHILVA